MQLSFFFSFGEKPKIIHLKRGKFSFWKAPVFHNIFEQKASRLTMCRVFPDYHTHRSASQVRDGT